jgi:hypothetical protein
MADWLKQLAGGRNPHCSLTFQVFVDLRFSHRRVALGCTANGASETTQAAQAVEADVCLINQRSLRGVLMLIHKEKIEFVYVDIL